MIQNTAIEKIRANPQALRDVRKDDEAFRGLVESIRHKGFIGSVSGQEKHDEEKGEMYIELIDGLQRFSAAKECGLKEIPVDVLELQGEAEVLEAQICMNIHKVETKPSEYSKQLERLLTLNPTRTLSDLATKIGKSTAYVTDRLKINKVTNPTLKRLIDEEKICISNAYALANLPEDEQVDWSDRAQTEPPNKFVPACAARIKQIKEDKRKGKDTKKVEFAPVMHMRSVKAIKDEFSQFAALNTILKENKITTAEDAAKMTLAWTLHMDPASVEEQRKTWDERKKKRDEAAAARKKEKEEKAAAKAAEESAKAEEALFAGVK